MLVLELYNLTELKDISPKSYYRAIKYLTQTVGESSEKGFERYSNMSCILYTKNGKAYREIY